MYEQRTFAGVFAWTVLAGCYTGAALEASVGSTGGGDESGGEAESGAPGTTDGDSTGEIPTHRGFAPGNLPPEIEDPGRQSVDEDAWLHLALTVRDPDDDPLRVWALGLPPGASWDEPARTLHFRPDFIQGGRAWSVTIVADDGEHRRELAFEVAAVDTIRPPAPTVVETEDAGEFTRYQLLQTTDDYLDSPGYAGRGFEAYVTVPEGLAEGERVPVRVSLHGLAAPPPKSGTSREIRIGPHDPENTYWWGYGAALPGGVPDGVDVPDYTLRRVLHLLEWTLAQHPEADPTRVFTSGSSMGGAGSMYAGLFYARHFCLTDAALFQVIPRNHRAARIATLSEWWGGVDTPIWERLDATRLLLESAEARDQYLWVRHAKDDGTIQFGAAVLPSPVTGEAVYPLLQDLGVGHFVVWDEGGHGPADPLLGGGWWSDGYSPIHDDTTFLRLDAAFPAFARSSADDDPGDGEGNGLQPWSDNAGFAGDVDVPGDTGWNGDIAGGVNRFLRWDAAAVVDTLDEFSLPLRVHAGPAGDPPAADYPTTGETWAGELPVRVDVTPRRVQAFRALPGERVAWSFGKASGEVVADAEGAITVPDLELGAEWQTLTLTRER
jgi:hypothetical protein